MCPTDKERGMEYEYFRKWEFFEFFKRRYFKKYPGQDAEAAGDGRPGEFF